jgi:nucleotide-binding universal stress UspA family protein
LGSVVEKVLLATSNPLLLVRARDMGSFKPEPRIDTIIAPLDGSTLSESVLEHVGPLAKSLNLKTLLLRVTPSAEQYYRAYDWSGQAYGWTLDLSKWAQEVDAEAEEYLRRLAAKLRAEHYPSVEERLLNGAAADAIVDTAKALPDCLVAMTTHGRSGIGRWALGSVADRVVRHSVSPVLLVRAKG